MIFVKMVLVLSAAVLALGGCRTLAENADVPQGVYVGGGGKTSTYLPRGRAEHGDRHLVFVLKTIKQSRGNAMELWSETIGAVSDIVLQRPDWSEHRAGDFMGAFDDMPLGAMREAAVALRRWPVRATLRVLILVELKRRLVAPALREAA